MLAEVAQSPGAAARRRLGRGVQSATATAGAAPRTMRMSVSTQLWCPAKHANMSAVCAPQGIERVAQPVSE